MTSDVGASVLALCPALLFQSDHRSLSRGMRQLNGVYTQVFNRHHGRVGHVFQGRYKAILVEKDSYLLELCRYIVLNPVRAAMVRSADEWPWSSYRATAGYERDLKALDVDWVLSAFGEKRAKAVENYEHFVADGKSQPSPWEKLKNQVFLGSDQFVDQMQRRIDRPERLSEIPRSQRRPLTKPLQFYRDSASSRNEAIQLAFASGGYSLKEIGDFFGIHYSRVSRIIREAKRKT